jgi:pSer/pThr/pTyr-binding forkhead associated (FHA) protein
VVPPVALLALRIGFVTLLWVFVLAVVLTLRTDLFGPRPSKARAATRPTPAPRPSRAPKRKASLRLVITEGALAGTTLPLSDQTVTIGRADSSTLVLTDDFVSNHHARLMRREGTWYLEDLGSTNGTYLDRQKVSDPTPLPTGVPVRIGKTVLELRS